MDLDKNLKEKVETLARYVYQTFGFESIVFLGPIRMYSNTGDFNNILSEKNALVIFGVEIKTHAYKINIEIRPNKIENQEYLQNIFHNTKFEPKVSENDSLLTEQRIWSEEFENIIKG